MPRAAAERQITCGLIAATYKLSFGETVVKMQELTRDELEICKPGTQSKVLSPESKPLLSPALSSFAPGGEGGEK